jgi:hypothetical protein
MNEDRYYTRLQPILFVKDIKAETGFFWQIGVEGTV